MSNKSYWEQRSNRAYSLATRKIEKPLKKLYVKVFRNIKEELIDIWCDMQKEEISQSALYQKQRMLNLQQLLQKELFALGEKNIELLQMGLYEISLQGFQAVNNLRGENSTFSFLDKQTAKTIVAQNYKGSDFSHRVWNDMQKLRQHIEDCVAKSALQGHDVRKVSFALQERMNVAYSSCKRIAVTETGRVFSESCRTKAQEQGYQTYSVLVEPDACDDCIDAFKGKHFNINESVLPLHPHCRCCMIIDID